LLSKITNPKVCNSGLAITFFLIEGYATGQAYNQVEESKGRESELFGGHYTEFPCQTEALRDIG